MAKGKGWTKEEKETIIQSLQPYLEMGYSRNKACNFIGLAQATLSNWIKENPALGMKVVGMESVVDTMVMANLRDAIRREGELPDDLKKENSWKWAERKMKNDGFSLRTEHTGAEGVALQFILNNDLAERDDFPQNTEDSSPE